MTPSRRYQPSAPSHTRAAGDTLPGQTSYPSPICHGGVVTDFGGRKSWLNKEIENISLSISLSITPTRARCVHPRARVRVNARGKRGWIRVIDGIERSRNGLPAMDHLLDARLRPRTSHRRLSRRRSSCASRRNGADRIAADHATPKRARAVSVPSAGEVRSRLGGRRRLCQRGQGEARVRASPCGIGTWKMWVANWRRGNSRQCRQRSNDAALSGFSDRRANGRITT